MAQDDFHPIQSIDPLGNVVQHKIEDDLRYSSLFDSNSVTINMYARPGTGISAAKWKISKEIYNSSGDSMRRLWANGTSHYDQINDASPGKTVVAATKANPISLEVTAHGYATGDFIEIEGATTMTQINSDGYGSIVFKIVKTDADNFTLQTAAGVAVDSSAYGVYDANSATANKKDHLNYTFS